MLVIWCVSFLLQYKLSVECTEMPKAKKSWITMTRSHARQQSTLSQEIVFCFSSKYLHQYVASSQPFFNSTWHQEYTPTLLSKSQPKCFCGMAGRNRLAPDPSVSVADICSALHSVTETEGCKDIQKALHSKTKYTWKSAPDADWLGAKSVSCLFQALFALHRNGVIAGTKFKSALLKTQNEKGRLNFSKEHDSDWSDSVDNVVRIGASVYRELKKCEVKYSRCVKKCSPEEKRNIDQVLGMLTLGENSETSQETEALPVPKDEKAVENNLSLDLALVSSSSSSASRPKLTIFTKVLQKKGSDPSSPTVSTKKQEQGLEQKKSSVPATVSGNVVDKSVAFDKDEKMELKTWMETAVLDTGKTKQQKKKKKKTQPAAGSKKSTKKRVTRTGSSSEEMPKKKKRVQANHKSSFKHRATSTAYHSAMGRALRDGKSKEEAKAAGRAASAQVSKDIEEGKLKEDS